METIQVQIGGQEYTLQCEDAERTRRLAHQLDTMMRQLKQKREQIPTIMLLVVAALNALEQYDLQVKQLQAEIEEYRLQLQEMQEFLERCVQQVNHDNSE